MAKVGKYRTRIDGVYREFEVYYTEKELFTIKNFPSEVVRIGHQDTLIPRFSSQDALETFYFYLIEKYQELSKTRTKVIGYKIVASIDFIMNKSGDNSWSGFKNFVPSEMAKFVEHGYGNNTVVGFAYEVYERVSSKEGYKYFEIKDDGTVSPYFNRSVESEYMIVEYSEELKTFFIELKEAMRQLAEKLIIVSGSQEAMKEIVASKTKLLG